MIKSLKRLGNTLSKTEQRVVAGGITGCSCGWCIRVYPFYDDGDIYRVCGAQNCNRGYRYYCQIP